MTWIRNTSAPPWESWRALDRKKDYGCAIAAYKKAIDLNPEYALTYSNMAMTLRNQHEMEAAKTAALKAVELDSNLAIAHNNLGMLLLDGGDLAGAVEHYEQAIKLDPTLAVAYFNLGSCSSAGHGCGNRGLPAGDQGSIRLTRRPTTTGLRSRGRGSWRNRAEHQAAVAADPTNALY